MKEFINLLPVEDQKTPSHWSRNSATALVKSWARYSPQERIMNLWICISQHRIPSVLIMQIFTSLILWIISGVPRSIIPDKIRKYTSEYVWFIIILIRRKFRLFIVVVVIVVVDQDVVPNIMMVVSLLLLWLLLWLTFKFTTRVLVFHVIVGVWCHRYIARHFSRCTL